LTANQRFECPTFTKNPVFYPKIHPQVTGEKGKRALIVPKDDSYKNRPAVKGQPPPIANPRAQCQIDCCDEARIEQHCTSGRVNAVPQ